MLDKLCHNDNVITRILQSNVMLQLCLIACFEKQKTAGVDGKSKVGKGRNCRVLRVRSLL